MVFFQEETNIFKTNIANTNTLKIFKYKTKSIANTAAANEILENATTNTPLKYLSNLW